MGNSSGALWIDKQHKTCWGSAVSLLCCLAFPQQCTTSENQPKSQLVL